MFGVRCSTFRGDSCELKVLVRDAAAFDRDFAAFADFADRLTAEFFEQHDPGGDLTHAGADYGAMREEAGKLVSLIERRVPAHLPES